MPRRRLRLTDAQYGELTGSRDWCARNGLFGLRDFYEQELAFQASRRALPDGAREYQRDDERTMRGPARAR
jgi:hypothetical protein